ncbi:glycosyl hydrolase [Massilioclostridium coli]|uniref:glycosyl hydrolase n=1 Tax=Massilioclostridium coli TaxID=1870991 RepID=UPI0022E455B1|nr:glycosyl hydrolase [Massilioclostridium coli]
MKYFKRITGAILALTMLGTVTVTNTDFGVVQASDTSFAEQFANPDFSYKPMTRMWWPNAPQDLDELESEIRTIAEAGYGGIEIACVADSSGYVDPVQYGWGSDAWNKAILLTLKTAKEVGITIDLTVGPHWPLSIPGVNPDTADSAKEMQTGQVVVKAGTSFNGEAPACDIPLNSPWKSDELLYASAAKILDTNYDESTGEQTYTYDSNHFIAVEIGENNIIQWTAPEDGNYVLFTYWLRGSEQRSQEGMNPNFELSDPIPYTVDHFSLEGTNAFIQYWEEHLLTPEIVELLKEVGGSFFEDSLELSGDIQWTAQLGEYFEQHRGYDITPYLPILYGAEVGNEELVERVTEDYNQTLNDMYVEYHVLPMQEWMNSYGLNFRTQSYGGCVDSSQTGSLVDIIEGELLTFSGMGISLEGDNTSAEWTVDNKFRMPRGGANMGKANIVSDEIGSLMGGDWTLTTTRLLGFMNNDFSAGVNNMVVHGFPYKYAPDTHWPTYATFAPLNFGGTGKGFGVSLNNYTPQWQAWDEMLDYIARNQFVLQQGKSKVDLAVYRHETSTNSKTLSDPALVDMGYTYDYVSPNAMLNNPKAVVKDGVLCPNGAGYQAMVLYDTEYLTLEGADLLLQYADAGLPIVVVGQTPSKVKGYGNHGQDYLIQEKMATLLAKDHVVQISDDTTLSQTIADMGIVPSTDFAEKEQNLITVRREDSNVDYYYLFNRSSSETVNVDVSFEGEGTPYLLNAYTGEVSRMAEYQVENGRVTANIQLDPRDAMLVAIGTTDWYTDGNAKESHVISTNADAIFNQNGLNITATQTGTYTVDLNDGSSKIVDMKVAQPIELNQWHLSLESWTPTHPAYLGVEDVSRYDTTKTIYEIELDDIVPWSELEGYEDVTGIGTYSTRFYLEDEWTGGTNARIDLGTVQDGYELYINGQQVLANEVTHQADLKGCLHVGENTVEIKVTSALINTLKDIYPELYAQRDSTVNGMLTNPVVLPYGIATISEKETDNSSTIPESSQPESTDSSSNPINSDGTVQTGDTALPVARIVVLAVLAGSAVVASRKKRH